MGQRIEFLSHSNCVSNVTHSHHHESMSWGREEQHIAFLIFGRRCLGLSRAEPGSSSLWLSCILITGPFCFQGWGLHIALSVEPRGEGHMVSCWELTLLESLWKITLFFYIKAKITVWSRMQLDHDFFLKQNHELPSEVYERKPSPWFPSSLCPSWFSLVIHMEDFGVLTCGLLCAV